MDRLSLKPASWHTKKDIPEGLDWSDRTILLWSEDECLRHDLTAEHIEDVVVRICGTMYSCVDAFQSDGHGGVLRITRKDRKGLFGEILGPEIDMIDGGDCSYRLYRDGWVICCSYDGESLLRVMLEA